MAIKQTIIQTKRLELTRITQADVHDVFETLNDEYTATILSCFTEPMTLEQASHWCGRSINGIKSGTEYMFIARQNSHNIGCISLQIKGEEGEDIAEIDYWVAKLHQRQGYATEMIQSIKEFASNRLAIKKLYATADPKNTASAGVLEKTGFSFAGTIDVPTIDYKIRNSFLYEVEFD